MNWFCPTTVQRQPGIQQQFIHSDSDHSSLSFSVFYCSKELGKGFWVVWNTPKRLETASFHSRLGTMTYLVSQSSKTGAVFRFKAGDHEVACRTNRLDWDII